MALHLSSKRRSLASGLFYLWANLVCVFLFWSCSNNGAGDANASGQIGDESTNPADNEASSELDSDLDGQDSGDDGSKGDSGLGQGEEGESDDFESCVETSANATPSSSKSNLIIAVDTSLSMREETEMVQSNINNRFAEKFGANPDVDVHIVLISEELDDPNDDGDGMCVSKPLGSGSCPDDTNPDELFWHIHEYVGSHNALEKIMDCYDGGPYGGWCDEEGHWRDFMSPGGFVHFVVVSDDNSGVDAGEFASWAAENFGESFMLHGIVSKTDGSGDDATPECEEYSDGEGTVYKELIAQTGGVFGDLCIQENYEFDAVFDQITTEVVTHVTMECEWVIPRPEEEEELDPGKVNVEFDDGIAIVEIGQVASPDMCANVEHGWYYDDPQSPSLIFVCPQTCEWIQGRPDAEMRLKFGCKTESAGPIL